jgi:hypothetical protein
MTSARRIRPAKNSLECGGSAAAFDQRDRSSPSPCPPAYLPHFSVLMFHAVAVAVVSLSLDP